MCEKMEPEVGTTHELPDGRSVRCVESEERECDDCVFYPSDPKDFTGCNKPDDYDGYLTCVVGEGHDADFRHFVLV